LEILATAAMPAFFALCSLKNELGSIAIYLFTVAKTIFLPKFTVKINVFRKELTRSVALAAN